MDYSQILFDKYQTALLTVKQVSEVTGRSTYSLEADRRAGEGISFKRVGGKFNSPVKYPLAEVSNYLNQVERVL